ncbi:unnamed protein product, partial [Adineta steineri]
MALVYADNPTLNGRFSDVATEPCTMLMPIEGYEKMPLVSLEKAVKPLRLLVPDVQRTVWIVKQRCENPLDELSPDESASIMLYTTEGTCRDDSFYSILNSTLRTEDRTKLRPWFLYLKLVLTALSKLPPIERHTTVYRGIRLDMSREYPQGKTFVWWGFSSCTTSIDVLEQDLFLGKTGPRTVFIIECNSGKSIRRHSYIEKEKEVLLLPGIQLQIIACSSHSDDLHIIQLKEVKPPYHLLMPLPGHPSPEKASKKFFSMILPRPNEIYQNVELVERIAKFKPHSLIDLERQFLTNHDMNIVAEQAVINKQCTILYLPNNRIASQGVSILARALHDNTSLERLDIFSNCVGDVGVASLAQVLAENNSTLKSLKLGWNRITDKGVGYLAEMLKKNRTLIELSLPWNRISDKGVKQLADALTKHNTTLKKLSLDLNDL